MADQEQEESPIAVPTGEPAGEVKAEDQGVADNGQKQEADVAAEEEPAQPTQETAEEPAQPTQENAEEPAQPTQENAQEPAQPTEDSHQESVEKPTEESGESKEPTAPKKEDAADQQQEQGAEAAVDKSAEQADDSLKEQVADKSETDNAVKDSKKQETDMQPIAPAAATTDTTGVGTDATQEKHEVDPHAASPEPVEYKIDTSATCTVKFVLMPSGQVATLACSLGQTLQVLKDHFANELKMPSNVILLMHEGANMDNEKTLADLGVGANGTVQLELQSSDPVNTPIKPYRPREEYHMPDVITVRVQSDEEQNSFKDVVVEIERTTRKKPYMGGYRHKESGVEFHHAGTQTMQKQRPPPTVPRYCRDTQTVEQLHYGQQTANDMSTQMTGIGVYVANITDKLMKPGPYTTADDHLNMVLRRIIIIQKYYRRWLAKRYVHKLKADKRSRLEYERQEEIRKVKDKEDRIKQEFERRMNPKNKEDFDLLYHALEKWRKEEETRINKELTDAERKAALCMLLDQETQLIAAIGRHKLEADDENKDKTIQAYLDKAAAPKKKKVPTATLR